MRCLSRLLGNNDEEFTEVRVDREVLESVIYYSKKSYPNEFLAFKDDDSFVEKLLEFDDYLYENKLNPGTTADLTAASIFLSYLAKEFN